MILPTPFSNALAGALYVLLGILRLLEQLIKLASCAYTIAGNRLDRWSLASDALVETNTALRGFLQVFFEATSNVHANGRPRIMVHLDLP